MRSTRTHRRTGSQRWIPVLVRGMFPTVFRIFARGVRNCWRSQETDVFCTAVAGLIDDDGVGRPHLTSRCGAAVGVCAAAGGARPRAGDSSGLRRRGSRRGGSGGRSGRRRRRRWGRRCPSALCFHTNSAEKTTQSWPRNPRTDARRRQEETEIVAGPAGSTRIQARSPAASESGRQARLPQYRWATEQPGTVKPETLDEAVRRQRVADVDELSRRRVSATDGRRLLHEARSPARPTQPARRGQPLQPATVRARRSKLLPRRAPSSSDPETLRRASSLTGTTAPRSPARTSSTQPRTTSATLAAGFRRGHFWACRPTPATRSCRPSWTTSCADLAVSQDCPGRVSRASGLECRTVTRGTHGLPVVRFTEENR